MSWCLSCAQSCTKSSSVASAGCFVFVGNVHSTWNRENYWAKKDSLCRSPKMGRTRLPIHAYAILRSSNAQERAWHTPCAVHMLYIESQTFILITHQSQEQSMATFKDGSEREDCRQCPINPIAGNDF